MDTRRPLTENVGVAGSQITAPRGGSDKNVRDRAPVVHLDI